MEAQLMRNMQQSDACSGAVLPAGRAITLHIGAGGRDFKVTEGRAWLTFTASRRNRSGRPPSDIWLSAGEQVHLPAGSRVVVEGWPQVSFELQGAVLEQPGLRWLFRQDMSCNTCLQAAAS